MSLRQRSRIWLAVLGSGLVLVHPTLCPGQDRGDGQSSTRISEPLQESGLDENRTVPRSNTTIDPGAIGPEPVDVDRIPNQPVPRREPGRGVGDAFDSPLPSPIGVPREVPADLEPQGSFEAPGFAPLFPEDIPTSLDPSFTGGGPDLSPEQLENLQQYEEGLLPAARSITDPAERSLALNRIAQSKISGGRYDEARAAVEEATQAALTMPRGLLRDLRLISIYRTFVDLAHDRVVEAVPTISPIASLLGPRAGAEPEDRRTNFLELSAEEFARAAEVVMAIDNANYRNEHLASVVQAQAVDSMKICNDASRAYSSREYLQEKAPELLAYADRILVQAAEQASRIERAAWQDQSRIVLTIAAARSNQFSRALAIARSIPRPEPRAEALMGVASSLARLSAMFRVGYGDAVRQSWESLRNGLETAAALPLPLEGQPEDFGVSMARQNLIDELIFRIESHSQNARSLGTVSDEVLLQLQQNEMVRRDVESPLGDTQALIDGVESLRVAAGELADALAALRDSLSDRRGALRSLDPSRPAEASSPTIPGMGDPRVAAVQGKTDRVIELLDSLSEPLDRAATPTYEESARSVAAIRNLDPRSNAAFLLVDSLSAVGRFGDARAAARLIPDLERRYTVLADIAESQGRRGLPDEARAWIAAEVPPDRQSFLYRSVEEGVLSSLDRLRTRAVGGFPRASSPP